jgi:hypothetical protein
MNIIIEKHKFPNNDSKSIAQINKNKNKNQMKFWPKQKLHACNQEMH